MIVNNKPTYKCEFCGKLYQLKKWCVKHEPICKKNPINNQRCREGCIYLEQREAKYIYQGISMGENMAIEYEEKEGVKDLLFCTKKKEFVYPFWCKNPILEEDIIEEIPNNPMPKKCNDFNENVI